MALVATMFVLVFFDPIVAIGVLSNMDARPSMAWVGWSGLAIAGGLAALSAVPSIIALFAASIGRSSWSDGRSVALGVTMAAIVELLAVTVYYLLLGLVAYATPFPESL